MYEFMRYAKPLRRLLFVFCLGISIGIIFPMLTRIVFEASMRNSLSLCSLSTNNQQYVRCLRDKFRVYAAVFSLESLMRYLEAHASPQALYSRNGSISTCHTVGHIVGEIAARSRKPIADLIQSCGTGRTCGDGCIHGVILEKIRTNPFGTLQADTQCNVLHADTLEADTAFMNCYHAFGHVYAQLSEYTMQTALQSCDSIRRIEDRYQCADGVFMELFRPTFDAREPYGSIDHEFEACGSVTEVYREHCYVQLGESIFLNNVHAYKNSMYCVRNDVSATNGCLYGFVGGVITEDGIGKFIPDACDVLFGENKIFCYEQAQRVLDYRNVKN